MARKRFSDLERVYDALKLAKVDISTLPAKLDIRKYDDWKVGEGPERSITRPSLGETVQVGITAFGLPDTNAASKIQIDWNTRAQAALAAQKTLLGITDSGDLSAYNANGSFTPAKVVFTQKGTKVTATSDITGRKYQKNNGSTYTAPFGQAGTNKTYFAALSAILDDSTTSTAFFVSAQPEQWRRD